MKRKITELKPPTNAEIFRHNEAVSERTRLYHLEEEERLIRVDHPDWNLKQVYSEMRKRRPQLFV